MKFSTCVHPSGTFVYGLHRPRFKVANLREGEARAVLGVCDDGTLHENSANFPVGDVEEAAGAPVYEIPNPFFFRGATYIGKAWADRAAAEPGRIRLPAPQPVSMRQALARGLGAGPEDERLESLFRSLPGPVRLALATTSTDPEDLVRLAELSCEFVLDDSGRPSGLRYRRDDAGRVHPLVHDHDLYEAVANNIALPDLYKEVMVLRPGVQGGSEIVGEWPADGPWRSHVFEYLRRNSYIPWGHYAANMANDTVRYGIDHLSRADFEAMRHLYYQRTYVRLAEELGIAVLSRWRHLDGDELENLRGKLLAALAAKSEKPAFDATLWGWNFGFDFAPSGYRLHASHQQVHQQYALVPSVLDQAQSTATMTPFACGDLVALAAEAYKRDTGSDFFADYLRCIRANQRMQESGPGPDSLVVHEDQHVVLFVPKAQTSQWELQLMTVAPVGNLLEADRAVRAALDEGIGLALRALTGLGARMVTSIEFSKRFSAENTGQRLLYSFLPRLPQSPGAFSEAQLRFINGHYPEDFAAACRLRLQAMADGAGY